ncbi:MAG TPA: CDP-alcohol phosphatidyltransferase family protein [Actinophytocola sp.]|uniref:CDP-alcohol phosphatidyltransferase family protein n=1 Tax=Actinophytocola sp. TaxID=1872138 RepID=UPI002DBCC4AB|nr:CDP-alcohol phosphatidyltransferase family protein [Actinophytocola sp.]HEU5470747.1 CDP-alcohol phosphatidyltransferase family protein [Actinophytocola sp.]
MTVQTAAPLRTLAAGATAQVALLAVLTLVTGLGMWGWLAAIAFGVTGATALAAGLRRSVRRGFGPADLVTLARAILVGGVTALVVDSVRAPASIPVLVAVTGFALALDAVDGQVARRTGTVSALGARFDMEVDAFLILVLSAYVATSLGPWVLLIGGMRYGFVAAGRVLTWLNAALPSSIMRKTVAAAQGIVLAVVASGLLPAGAAVAMTGLALAALIWSFGQDVRWLHRNRVVATVVHPTPRMPATLAMELAA